MRRGPRSSSRTPARSIRWSQGSVPNQPIPTRRSSTPLDSAVARSRFVERSSRISRLSRLDQRPRSVSDIGGTEEKILLDDDRRSGAFLRDFISRHRIELMSDAEGGVVEPEGGGEHPAESENPNISQLFGGSERPLSE